MSEERWLPVVGFEGRYEVSDQGRVRSLDRTDSSGRARRGRMLKQHAIGEYTQHWSVALYRSGRQFRRLVHRLMAEAFLGACPAGQVVRHLDDNPDNNTIGNIAYGTSADNQFDAIRNGRNRNSAKTECPQGHRYTQANTRLRRTSSGRVWRSCRTCAVDGSRRWRERNRQLT